jgi:hypothetical protein
MDVIFNKVTVGEQIYRTSDMVYVQEKNLFTYADNEAHIRGYYFNWELTSTLHVGLFVGWQALLKMCQLKIFYYNSQNTLSGLWLWNLVLWLHILQGCYFCLNFLSVNSSYTVIWIYWCHCGVYNSDTVFNLHCHPEDEIEYNMY